MAAAAVRQRQWWRQLDSATAVAVAAAVAAWWWHGGSGSMVVAMALAVVVMVAVAVTSRRWLQPFLLGEFGLNIPKWNNSTFL